MKNSRIFLLHALVSTVAAICLTAAAQESSDLTAKSNLTAEIAPPVAKELIWEADLSDTTGWIMDGKGTARVSPGDILHIDNQLRTVYWIDHVFTEPVLLDFEVRTSNTKCRAILFFMAQGVDGKDIFRWTRPGDYGDYAYDETMELYTVGLMREGCGTESNFRFLGGIFPEKFAILKQSPKNLDADGKVAYRKAFQDFQPYSIRSSVQDGYTLGKWMRYQILVAGNSIRVWADGRLLHDVVDETPLTQGRVGFRNFAKGTRIDVRNLKAFRP